MALHQKYNNEDILSRAVIAGVLNILNNKITYEQVWGNEDIETIEIPWFYNMSGDERFMQDFYTHYAHCLPPKPVDGNFDVIPRGIVTYTGSEIDSTRITSRYVQGTYLKEIDGQLQTYRSFLFSIPLNINLDCEVTVDTQITSLKVEQAVRELFYKTITFYVYYKGMRVGCTAGFPEDITLEKNIDYSFEAENKIKLKFNIQVETYQPVFDPTTEVNANDYMTGVGMRLFTQGRKEDGYITITTPTSGTEASPLIIPRGYPLLIEWDYYGENAIINKVDVLWSTAGSNERNVIEKGVPNHEYYVWNIPESFNTFKIPTILWPQDGSVYAYREPIIKITPDSDSIAIDASSFHIIDGGYFLSADPDASINIVLEMKDDTGGVHYSDDGAIYFNLSGNTIVDQPILPLGDVTFPGTVDYKVIDIYVNNSVTTLTDSAVSSDEGQPFGVVRNLKIV